mgnify:CR=1 FL=1
MCHNEGEKICEGANVHFANVSFSNLTLLCTICGTCVAVCPYNVLVLREESFKRLELHELEVTHDIYESIEKLCQQCGYCYYNCPVVSFNLEKAEKNLIEIMEKLDLHNRSELIRYAMRKGLVSLDT